jgi:DNA-binding NarL/FixJ family response regulator
MAPNTQMMRGALPAMNGGEASALSETRGHLMTRSLKVAVIERDERSRWTLEFKIRECEGCNCIGSFPEANELMANLEKNTPDVVLIGVRFSPLAEISSLRSLKQALPSVKILILTSLSDEMTVVYAVECGADGYLIEPITGPEMADAVRVAYHDGVPLSPIAARYLVDRVRPRSATSRSAGAELLTPRELEIMSHVARGQSDKEIARLLRLSLLTVKRHLHNTYSKLGVENRVQAINRVIAVVA